MFTAASRARSWQADDLRLLGSLLEPLGTGRVADLGCGAGELGALLLRARPALRQVDGFDLDPEQRARGRARGERRLRFLDGDAEDLFEVDDRSYDAALCQALLCHSRRPERILAEMARVTRPGGPIVAIEPDWVTMSESRDDALIAEQPALRALDRACWTLVARGSRACGAGDYALRRRLDPLAQDAGLEGARLLRCGADLRWERPDDRELIADLDELSDDPDHAELLRPLFLAGGGHPDRWEAWLAALDEWSALRIKARRRAGWWERRSPGLWILVARTPR